VPAGLLLAQFGRPYAARALRATILAGGLLLLVLATYVVVVVGLGQAPSGDQQGVLVRAMVAAAVALVLAVPARQRLVELSRQLIGEPPRPASVALDTFGARMTRAVPMDELLLQLAESLRATVGPAGAEIWTGFDGHLELAVAVPDRKRQPLNLALHERDVATRARVNGNAWIEVWIPQLLSGRERHSVRVAPITHLGQLLGLLVVMREPGQPVYGEQDDSTLADLARQVGLALHNVRLDSALQASLTELQKRNAELQASRARIVATADESRRTIERNLHDGAQQHLVALAVKIGLAKQELGEAAPAASSLLDELRSDVQAAIGEVRELGHGIYPPLLRDRGLPEALATAARRSPQSVTVDAKLPGRFPADVEAAAYFCCLEALQNAGKYAGRDAHVEVVVTAVPDHLIFEVHDNGSGFEVAASLNGHGFTNMADRLGAIGGQLFVESSAGNGALIRGTLPARPLASDAEQIHEGL
jgi:signal transduction histidine kinase